MSSLPITHRGLLFFSCPLFQGDQGNKLCTIRLYLLYKLLNKLQSIIQVFSTTQKCKDRSYSLILIIQSYPIFKISTLKLKNIQKPPVKRATVLPVSIRSSGRSVTMKFGPDLVLRKKSGSTQDLGKINYFELRLGPVFLLRNGSGPDK